MFVNYSANPKFEIPVILRPLATMASSQLVRTAVLVCALASASAFAPVSSRVSLAPTTSRAALVMVAKTTEDKALLASSKKVRARARASGGELRLRLAELL